MAYTHNWLPISYSYTSSAGQGRWPAERPTFYYCSTQSTIIFHSFIHLFISGSEGHQNKTIKREKDRQHIELSGKVKHVKHKTQTTQLSRLHK